MLWPGGFHFVLSGKLTVGGCCYMVKKRKTYEKLTSESSLLMKCQHKSCMYTFEAGFKVEL